MQGSPRADEKGFQKTKYGDANGSLSSITVCPSLTQDLRSWVFFFLEYCRYKTFCYNFQANLLSTVLQVLQYVEAPGGLVDCFVFALNSAEKKSFLIAVCAPFLSPLLQGMSQVPLCKGYREPSYLLMRSGQLLEMLAQPGISTTWYKHNYLGDLQLFCSQALTRT